MVMAHLRGLLPKEQKYGIQSLATEVVILESLMATESANSLARLSDMQAAYFDSLSEDSKKDVMKHNKTRLKRIAELRSLDVYQGEKQLLHRSSLGRKTSRGDLSLFKLFQLASDQGIFEDIQASFEGAKWKPII